MEHLCDASPLNAMVTTITAQVKLRTAREEDLDYITADKVYDAVDCIVRRNNYTLNRKTFKNCRIFGVIIKSTRGGKRSVSVKVFRNLTLHIVGSHSLEMINKIAARIAAELSDEMKLPLTPGRPDISMVNYAYSLPGPVRLRSLCELLRDTHNLLVFFDPSKYAGVTVKVPIQETTCSLMIFESRKIIISTPRCAERDTLLSNVIKFIETAVVHHWNEVRMV